MIEIANPIYDCVFKYLLEDTRVVKLFFETLLDVKIKEIQALPQEQTLLDANPSDSDPNTPILPTTVRMDFAARIALENGRDKQVILELQKSSHENLIERYRKYIGTSYMDRRNMQFDPLTKSIQPLPILSVYLLGYNPGFDDESVVIDIIRNASSREHEGDILDNHHFVDMISHDSIIVLLRNLSGKERSPAERMLNIFNQNKKTNKRSVLLINKENVPKEYIPFINRLKKANKDPMLQEKIQKEDYYQEWIDSIHKKVRDQADEIERLQQAAVEKEKEASEKERLFKQKAAEKEMLFKQEAAEKERLLQQEIAELKKRLG